RSAHAPGPRPQIHIYPGRRTLSQIRPPYTSPPLRIIGIGHTNREHMKQPRVVRAKVVLTTHAAYDQLAHRSILFILPWAGHRVRGRVDVPCLTLLREHLRRAQISPRVRPLIEQADGTRLGRRSLMPADLHPIG